MALFGGKEAKEQAKAEAAAAKVRAKLAQYHLEDVDGQYVEACADIIGNLAGSGMMELGSVISGMKTEEELKVTYLHAIMDQNWIIIRQLDRIAKALER